MSGLGKVQQLQMLSVAESNAQTEAPTVYHFQGAPCRTRTVQAAFGILARSTP